MLPPPAPSSSPRLGDDTTVLGPDTTPDRGQFDDREYSTKVVSFSSWVIDFLPSDCLVSVM